MTDFKALIKLLQSTVADFATVLPGIQKQMLDRLRVELNFLDIGKGGTIAMKAQNVARIAQIRAKLMELMVTPAYQDAVKKFVGTFNQIDRLQNAYFEKFSSKYKPSNVAKALKQQAVETSVLDLTERGLDANVVSGVEDLLRKSITTGGSYTELQAHLENYLTENETGEGQLQKYAKQITTDALNQYSAQYSQIAAADLGLEWFIYAGSNIETSRPFCIACTQKRYIHRSEIPALLAGDFQEFRDAGGKLYKGLPAGMIPDTTPANFQINRGGYNCGHQLRPVSEKAVPQAVRDALGKAPQAAPDQPPPPPPPPAAPAISPRLTQTKERNKAPLEELEQEGFSFYDDIAEYWAPDITILNEPGNAKGSYYEPATKTLVIGSDQDRRDLPYYREKIMAHEGGHAMHFEQDIITFDKIHPDFQTFYDKCKDIVRGKEADLDALFWDTGGKNYFAGDMGANEELSILHDTLGGLTHGLYGAGHKPDYYATLNRGEMEVFAHAITLAKLDNRYSDLNETIKELTDAMKEYALDLLK